MKIVKIQRATNRWISHVFKNPIKRHGKTQAWFTMVYLLNMTSMQIMVAHKEILSKHINKLPEEHRRYLDDNLLLLINFRDISLASFLNNHLKTLMTKSAIKHKKCMGKMLNISYRDSIGVLIPDPGKFGLPFFCNSK